MRLSAYAHATQRGRHVNDLSRGQKLGVGVLPEPLEKEGHNPKTGATSNQNAALDRIPIA